ncbi:MULTISPECIES: aldehyde dehydrogenase family protein [unclassified Paenibacillus]|uniref:aldehyde dehydrogenase family protein n=1 Tax=unclassified Paenibacillus TaxID=185978 RepID=UPI001AEABB75|nr:MULTISPECIES: aldehyde dehydrogenase family protein [unclassified Paenibacillus]MBP1154049.1 betaine-aldehyde dehydrogenase [Paenibacillus sp. PvP091]MBP1170566.1 betaine-aldehyde dehydrogenase [Paenibacillus sp. PvR098]MBP2441594.1 betaine-aldehyde dehydrogenase [Paenibacillus sp. PvP052]
MEEIIISIVIEKGKNRSKAEWESLAKQLLDRDWKMTVGDRLVKAKSGKTYTTTNPSTGEILGEVPLAQPEDVNEAVETAAEAQRQWKKVPPLRRAAYLREIAAALKERAHEFAALDAIDSGNPVIAMYNDVERAVQNLQYCAGLATELKGETIPSSGVHWHITRREPFGVVGQINPYNHPIGQTATKIGMPLMAGNTVVVKTPDQPPLSSLLFGEMVKEILPPGVVNILSGNGPVTGDAIVRHPMIKRLSLTGSVPTGKAIMKSAAETGIKHVTLELGGKNAMMVFPDADIEAAVNGAFYGMNFLRSQGQSCGSMTRLFLHESVYDPFIAKLVEKTKEAKLGNPLDPVVNMGPVVSEAQYEKVMYYIRAGHEDGAKLLVGGEKPGDPELANGYFVPPTIFTGVTPEMRIFREEIFGPVQSVIKWKTYDELIAMTNSVSYGLTASIWSNNFSQILTALEDIEAGYVWVNGYSAHYTGVPFGGFKESGLGTEEGLEELFSYTQTKAIHFVR